MPLQLYYCKSCESEFEILVKREEIDSQKCIYCNSKKLKKTIGVPSLKFVGNGWAKDGYASVPKEANIERKDSLSTITKTPIIKDRNTGKTLGLGKPQVGERQK